MYVMLLRIWFNNGLPYAENEDFSPPGGHEGIQIPCVPDLLCKILTALTANCITVIC